MYVVSLHTESTDSVIVTAPQVWHLAMNYMPSSVSKKQYGTSSIVINKGLASFKDEIESVRVGQGTSTHFCAKHTNIIQSYL